MNRFIIYFIALFCMGDMMAQNVANGKTQFNKTCVACHSIGKGKIVGPDLKGVTAKRNEKWLMQFIRSSQTLIKKGDKDAVAIFQAYNKMPMPDHPQLKDNDIKDILAYIKSMSPAASPKPSPAPSAKAMAPAPPQAPPKNTVEEWTPSEIKINCQLLAEKFEVKNINALYWNNAKETSIPLNAQKMAYPNLASQSIMEIKVKSVYTNKWIYFKISWQDSNKSSNVDVNKFCDQLAIQLPANVNNIPSYMMGNQGGAVHIVHWKAAWQEDCENGFRDVTDVYPNTWVDVYPGQEATLDRSKRVYAKDITPEQIVDSRNFNTMPGTYSQNPISSIKRKVPVEEAAAVGFGSLTTQATQLADGWAEWKDGQWTVILAVPVNTGNIQKASFKDKTKIAFAVWEGGSENIGGRKQLSTWCDLLMIK